MRWVQVAKELTLSVLEDVSRRKFDEAYPTRRLEVLKAPRRIYRLPPLPPTSPALDASMIRCSSAWAIKNNVFSEVLGVMAPMARFVV